MMQCHWILGPGAIGRLLAHSLTPLMRAQLIGRRGLPAWQTLTTPSGKQCGQTLSIQSVTDIRATPTTAPDILHITTKAMVAEAALQDLADLVAPTTPLVLWQNGFLAQPRLTASWSGPVLCASTTEGAYLTADNAIVHAGHGQTWVGDLYHQHDDLAHALAITLNNAGLITQATDDILGRLWQKLAVNAAINPLAALNGICNGALRQATYAPRVDAIISEVAAIMRAERVMPPNLGCDGAQQAWRALVWSVVDSTAANKASMLQDVEAQRPTERGAILTPLIESAERNGLRHDELTALDQALEKLEGRYLPSPT